MREVGRAVHLCIAVCMVQVEKSLGPTCGGRRTKRKKDSNKDQFCMFPLITYATGDVLYTKNAPFTAVLVVIP